MLHKIRYTTVYISSTAYCTVVFLGTVVPYHVSGIPSTQHTDLSVRSVCSVRSVESLPKPALGGSVAGVSCAHSLISSGWDVVVLEKSYKVPTGAGLGLDPLSLHLIQSWIKDTHLLNKTTLPLTIDQNDAVDGEKNIRWTLTRDEGFNCRAAHWGDLHALLYDALPPDLFLWGHNFQSFSISSDRRSVKVKALVLESNEIIEVVGDLLIEADGCLSKIRQSFLPDHKLRYSGYCAWRGVFDFAGNEKSEL